MLQPKCHRHGSSNTVGTGRNLQFTFNSVRERLTEMLTRRRFAKGALASLAIPATPSRGAQLLRAIPSTGQTVPAIGLGSWITFNVGTDPVLLDACAEVIAAFVEEGGA